MKAAAEARNMEKGAGSEARPAWLSGAMSWGPEKFKQLKSFFTEVKTELRKVTWPSRAEVYATTIVVILTTIFFGFYLYGLDLVMSQIFSRILGR